MKTIDELLDESTSLRELAEEVLQNEKLFRLFDRVLAAFTRRLKDDTGLQPQELSLLEFTLYVWDVKGPEPHAMIESLRQRHEGTRSDNTERDQC